eukprot:GHVU01218567.1.p1 GENE.GHVU01218567.1~~GHVU01218567.1.p1  ORF type:complete len:100 (-),score=4.42 GHVU01218567.1:544-843(-)
MWNHTNIMVHNDLFNNYFVFFFRLNICTLSLFVMTNVNSTHNALLLSYLRLIRSQLLILVMPIFSFISSFICFYLYHSFRRRVHPRFHSALPLKRGSER